MRTNRLFNKCSNAFGKGDIVVLPGNRRTRQSSDLILCRNLFLVHSELAIAIPQWGPSKVAVCHPAKPQRKKGPPKGPLRFVYRARVYTARCFLPAARSTPGATLVAAGKLI